MSMSFIISRLFFYKFRVFCSFIHSFILSIVFVFFGCLCVSHIKLNRVALTWRCPLMLSYLVWLNSPPPRKTEKIFKYSMPKQNENSSTHKMCSNSNRTQTKHRKSYLSNAALKTEGEWDDVKRKKKSQKNDVAVRTHIILMGFYFSEYLHVFAQSKLFIRTRPGSQQPASHFYCFLSSSHTPAPAPSALSLISAL